MDLGIRGVSALVGGASAGLGFACAQALAREGARVTMVSRSRERVERAARAVREATGGEAVWAAADLATPDGPASAVEQATKAFGAPLIVVANTGGPPSIPADTADVARLEEAAHLLLHSLVRLVGATLPAMRKAEWGRIVAITSIAARQPQTGLVLSNTIRAGAMAYVKSLANEAARSGITFNTVCPGYTATERLSELAEVVAAREGKTIEAIYAAWAAANPVGRLGDADEIGAAVAFLASRQAAFINGIAFPVDGGRSAALY